MKNTIFFAGMGCLFTHELDAVANSEWKLLPVLGSLSDELGMTIFIAVHVPLFAVVAGLVASERPRVRRLSRIAFSGFLVLHGLLHLAFSADPRYEFTSALSAVLIYAGALLGALHLLLTETTIGKPGRT